MKFVLVLMLCALAASAPSLESPKVQVFDLEIPAAITSENRNIFINILVRQLIEFIKLLIRNGSSAFGIPPLDPLVLEHYYLNIPAGLLNIELELKDAIATGFGDFVVNRSNLNMRDLTFDIDFTFPVIDIKADAYNLFGDFFTAIPLYGNGKATFLIENFRFQAKLFLKQSEDGRSVIIDRIENASFEIPSFKSKLTGVIGGGDIDAIAMALLDEVIIDYVKRFQGAISIIAAQAVMFVGNPVLNQLDTWRFLAPFA